VCDENSLKAPFSKLKIIIMLFYSEPGDSEQEVVNFEEVATLSRLK
jgi:hypothetical protein